MIQIEFNHFVSAVADAEESAVPTMTPSAAESASLASTESAMLGYSIMDQIADSLDKSDSETIVRCEQIL